MKLKFGMLMCVLGMIAFIGIFAINANANGPNIIYSEDFETNNGGWVPWADWDPVGDWEWTNSYDVNNYVNGTYGDNPPPTAHSGNGLWGTVLYHPYTNSDGDTFLSKTFDFSGYSDLNMTFWYWSDVFGTASHFDYSYVTVNGTQVWYNDSYDATAWEQATIDLSAWAGQSDVNVTFGMHATTVVNYTGLYIDDVAFTGSITSFVFIDENHNGQFDAGEWNGTMIQAAIDAASAGDTIYVWDGEYLEDNITVNKPLTIIGNTTVNALDGIGTPSTSYLYYQHKGFIIEADYVNISGFQLINQGIILPCGGISLNHSEHCNISGNIIIGDYDGIYLNDSHYNIIYNNYISNNYIGIWMVNDSGHNTILMNNISWNGYGIVYEPYQYQYHYVPGCWNNITYNNISNNRQWGIMMGGTHNETVAHNEFYYNGQGSTLFAGIMQMDGPTLFTSGAIGFFDTVDSTIGYNTIYGYYGIDLRNCTNVTVEYNQLFAGQDQIKPPVESYEVYAIVNGAWKFLETVHTDAQYAPMTVLLPQGATEVRIEQHGGVAAHMDYVALFDGSSYYKPTFAAINSKDELPKISEWDNDVADMHETTIYLSWDTSYEGAILFMVANEEQQQATARAYYTPWFMFPSFMESYTLTDNGVITVDGVPDMLGKPDFFEFWRPIGSGHPWGYTYLWLRCDGEYLYATMEITSDNTFDDTGWGALYISVDGVVQEFRVDTIDDTYGVNGFVYTDTISYQHMVYEFAIPLAEIKVDIGDTIRVGYGSYGTEVSLQSTGIHVAGYGDDNGYENTIVNCLNVIQYNTLHQYDYGIVLDYTDNETVMNNILINNSHNGIYLVSCRDILITDNMINGDSGFKNTGIMITSTIPRCYNTVANNTIWGHWTGISLDHTDNETVRNNHIYENYNGINLWYAAWNAISSNTITHNNRGIYLYNSQFNMIIDNYIADNRGQNTGIHIEGDSNHTHIMGNTIKNNDIGIYIQGDNYGMGPYYNTDTEIHWNLIYNNSIYGLQYYMTIGDTPYVNATYNWWGSANGPNSIGGNQRDPVTYTYAEGLGDFIDGNALDDNIHFDPWLGLMLYQGWNMINTAFMVEGPQTAEELGQLINSWEGDANCTVVTMWDTLQQKYVSHIVGYGFDFNLTLGYGYFVYVTQDINMGIYGGITWPSINITLHVGYNMIGWPYVWAVNASSLAENITNCVKVAKWDDEFQLWLPEYIEMLMLPYDFDVLMGEGVFVFIIDGPVTWQYWPPA